MWSKLQQFSLRMTAIKKEIDEIDELLASSEQTALAANPRGLLQTDSAVDVG